MEMASVGRSPVSRQLAHCPEQGGGELLVPVGLGRELGRVLDPVRQGDRDGSPTELLLERQRGLNTRVVVVQHQELTLELTERELWAVADREMRRRPAARDRR